MTFSVVWELISTLWSNKYLRYGSIGLLAFIGIFFLYQHQINKAYDKGIAYQTDIYNKEQKALKDEYQKRLDSANTEREALNLDLQKQKDDYAILQKEREEDANKTQTEVIKYVQSSSGSKRCLDANWLRVYKNSLPK